MRLINTSTLHLEEFFESARPKYAILSHTWGLNEVALQEWQEWERGGPDSRVRTEAKHGFQKIKNTCRIAQQEGISHVWVDTDCIDKKSSAELSEAINSMFAWYQGSSVCYVYLEDLEPGQSQTSLSQCRWFTRGWTLQELLAPTRMTFYDSTWESIGSKAVLAQSLVSITGIETNVLLHPEALYSACLAKRMSWASTRQTTRSEDMAYCLLGIFQIHMPLLYGEGSEAFRRLQEEIMKMSTDQSLFAWDWTDKTMEPQRQHWISLMAPHPSVFAGCSRVIKGGMYPLRNSPFQKEFTMSNLGLSIALPLIKTYSSSTVYAALDCRYDTDDHEDTIICIPLWATGVSSTFRRDRLRPLANLSIPTKHVAEPAIAVYFPRFSELSQLIVIRHTREHTQPSGLGSTQVLFRLFSCNNALKRWHVYDDFAGFDPAAGLVQVAPYSTRTLAGKEIKGFCIRLRNFDIGDDGGDWALIIMSCKKSGWRRVFFERHRNEKSTLARKQFMDGWLNKLDESRVLVSGNGAVCGRLRVEVGLEHNPPSDIYSPVVPLFFDINSSVGPDLYGGVHTG
ncbi:hypothetical protein EsH8_IV_000294 [Colletotrichum jinshuiense]